LPQPGLAAQIANEIVALLQCPEVRRALEARQGRLIIDWREGHVVYCEPQPRYRVPSEIRLPPSPAP
jgi:hypothetical protein